MTASVRVFGYGSHGSLPDVSPFVQKLEFHLRLAGVEYEKVNADVRKAPRSKLPYIEHEGRQVPDSQGAIDYLQERGIADLDAHLSADQRAEAFALRAMVERDLYFAITYFRWQAEPGWAVYSQSLGTIIRAGGVPGFLLPLVLRKVRKGVIEQLHQQGIGRLPAAEIEAHGRKILATLGTFCERTSGPFWFGVEPSSFDAVMVAFVGALVGVELPSPLEDAAREEGALMRCYEHVRDSMAD